jgi:hypothetical protein
MAPGFLLYRKECFLLCGGPVQLLIAETLGASPRTRYYCMFEIRVTKNAIKNVNPLLFGFDLRG